MSSVAPTRLSMMVPLVTSRSLNCTLARRLPGVLWSALVMTNNLPSMRTAWPLRMSLARIVIPQSLLRSLSKKRLPEQGGDTAATPATAWGGAYPIPYALEREKIGEDSRWRRGRQTAEASVSSRRRGGGGGWRRED